MRKFFTIFFISILFLLSITVFFLSTTGYETKRFNNLINNKLQNIDEKISLELNEIKLKLDIKKLNFFLSTENLKINYNKTPVALPAGDISNKHDITSEPTNKIFLYFPV